MYNIKDITITDMVQFLQKYYVNSNDDFQLWYTEDVLKIILNDDSMLLGIYSDSLLIGVIASIPDYYFIRDLNFQKTSEITFLCCHPDYRNKGVAKKLIDEITKRCLAKQICHGFFAGSSLHSQITYANICEAEYYHRPINIKKLFDSNFLDTTLPLNAQIEYYKINVIESKYSLIKINDVSTIKDIYKLYLSHLKNHTEYCFYQLHSLNYFIKLLNNKFVFIYGIYEGNILIDFVIFYMLPLYSNKTNDLISNAYLYMYTDNNVKLDLIIYLLLIQLKKLSIDVLTVLKIMNTDNVIMNKMFRFMQGTGKLFYNSFGFSLDKVNSSQIYKMIV